VAEPDAEHPDAARPNDGTDSARRAVEAVWRIEAPRLVGALSRLVRDVGLAEDLAQDALVAALEQWTDGVPDNPGAWLMTTARRRAIDVFRREERYRRKQAELAHDLAGHESGDGDVDDALDDHIGDDVLRLMVIACHPVVPMPSRVALTLRMVGGLTTREIARAFLVPEATVSQRIVRAKRTIAEAGVPFELPAHAEMPARLGAVLEVLYLVFNEGYAASAGTDWTRPELCEESVRLGRVLARVAPGEPEVHGLVALMQLQASRLRARRGPDDEPVLLMDQDRSRWDRLLIALGLAALARARELGGKAGPYALQAAVAACHARAAHAADTDWPGIASLYDALAQVTPSPVVELNRAVAVGMAYGPAAGLEALVPLLNEPRLAGYHLLPSVHADLLLKVGRRAEAAVELRRAAGMTGNAREQALLLTRAATALRDAAPG
jgi:RNA polymerase sigma factor (sigma-70 family)